jgi:carboxyl-terminal processing protease
MNEQASWKVYTPLIIGISLGLGYFMGTFTNSGVDSSPKSSENSGHFNMLSELINYIDAEYVDEVSKNDLIDKTVVHLLQELDPHSYYITPDEFAQMNEPLEGNFDGVGIQFNVQKDTLVVIDPIIGGPSEKVGIKAGDRIIRVDDSLIAGVGVKNRTILKLLKGVKGTKVEVTIVRRQSEELVFNITRDKIPIHSVSSVYMLDKKAGYIKVDRFGANTTKEFLGGMQKLKKSGAVKAIIDLRGNGGGYMNAATSMLDAFFHKGELLVFTEGKARSKTETLAKEESFYPEMKIVVLIDEGSASASEIFAGAIQDHDRGVVIGRRSFGKGLVQEQTVWPNGAATRLTIARYYTPSGRCIQKPYTNGVEDYNKEYFHRYDNGEMLSKDSIVVNDSLRYTTDNGRPVYGGGGIIPDVFVAIDTTRGSIYLNQLVYTGTIYDFSFNYADNHRAEILKHGTAEEYILNFQVTSAMLEDLKSFAQERGVIYHEEGFNRSKELVIKRLRAYIARNIWNDEGFYPIWNSDDPTIKAALESDLNSVLDN